MIDQYRTALGSGGTPGSTREVTTEALNLWMDHALDLAPQFRGHRLRRALPLAQGRSDATGDRQFNLTN